MLSPDGNKRTLENENDTTNTAPLKQQRTVREPLEANVDYISLQSSLSLLQTRADQIKKDMQELAHFKGCLKETSSVKDMVALLKHNSDYLSEIQYKGCYIKCPEIDWTEYGVSPPEVNHESIDEHYEIIKRDRLF